MDGDRPIAVGGDLQVTGMGTTMDIAMVIRTGIVPDIMQADAPHTAGPHPIPTEPGPPTMYITIEPRGSEEPGTITMMPGQATGYQQPTGQPGPPRNLPTGPTMSILTGMAMSTARMGTTGTGWIMAAVPPGRQGHQPVSNPLPGSQGHQPVSNPHNRTAPPTATPGRDRRVRAV